MYRNELASALHNLDRALYWLRILESWGVGAVEEGLVQDLEQTRALIGHDLMEMMNWE